MLLEFIASLKENADYRDILSHYEYMPAKPVEYYEGDLDLPGPLVQALARLGIPRLFSHQGEALAAIRTGKHLLVATPTASGKTLIYNLPVLESLLAEPQGHALYLFPLKALEQDQLKALQELDAALPSPFLTAAIYDGDTPPGPAPGHQGASRPTCSSATRTCSTWGSCRITPPGPASLPALKFVVIDEVHTYRGIMGSHMAQVLRRLRRICAHYGSHPQFLLSSATIAQPADFHHGR